MSIVVILGGSKLQVPAILAAKRLGFRVICADYDQNAVGFGYADESSLVSTTDADAIEALARNVGADFVITSTSDAPVRTAALVSERLGLPTGISYANARCATFKDEMRVRMREHRIPIPEFRVCSSFKDFKGALRDFSYSCVVKPADSSASRGVRLVDGFAGEDVTRGLYDKLICFSKRGVLMVEELMRGREVSVEAMTVGSETTILSVTDKLVTPPPCFVELGHSEPSELAPSDIRRIEDVACRTVSAIGIVDGPSHTEIMLTDEGPKVVETAARLGGDFITSKLVPLSTGVDLVEGSVAIALGLEYDFTTKAHRGSAIRFITSDMRGTIASIDGVEEARSLEGVEEIEMYLRPGDSIDSPHSSNDRIGHVVAASDTAAHASIIAEKAVMSFRVSVI